MLSCRGLCARYEGAAQDALANVSLDVLPGHIVGLVGRSGAGKSTLLSCLAGQGLMHAGTLVADGVAWDAREEQRDAYRTLVGFVQQLPERQLFAATVEEDVAFGPRNLGLNNQDVKRRISWALDAVGLAPEEFLGRSPFSLSGGEARRVAFAGMLALKPRYLLLDEPTAGLDPRETSRLQVLVSKLAHKGMGVVVSSHDMELLAGISSEVVVLDKGRVAASGAAGKILGDVEGLAAHGLAAPVAARLAQKLRERGIAVPPDTIDARGIARALGVAP